ncbi:BC1881 family protein [Vallitalea guaymasensis]|uniref:BC1881 family protein n=1 Tax=Vallitalea guaymasensis TaxID=1185412 RepID=UPI000DE554BC|nr:BC1881 family protein [Vallitalea guaymasensis]
MHKLEEIATCELVEELIRREGVNEIILEPYEKLSSKVADPIEGPARVLCVID